ncbi:MAG: LicD family protein [Tenericutes bacterium ADurb.BinA124]|nr:MAG: LicD family protein [Tenericutes bacterium ADurb.BinA124]
MELKYMRKSLSDDYGFLELQDKILEIAVYMDKMCKDNSISYYLMGGSALGAKRHGGFIPWDDDLDFFMTPDNYEKFRNVFNNSGDKSKYYLQEWGAIDGMVTIAKIRMNGTSYIEESLKNWDIHQGIYVDIFILHNCPNNKLSRLHQYIWAKYVIMKGLAERGYSRRKGFLGFCLKVMKLFPCHFLVKHGLKQVYKYRKKETKCYCNFLGKAVLKNGVYKKDYFLDGFYIPFETVYLKVPTNIHDFLVDRFGDYMKPPSPERIKWEQHAESWNCSVDFKQLINRNEWRYSDEGRLI